MEELSSHYNLHPYSLEFNDDILESKYKVSLHLRIKGFIKLYLCQVILSFLVYIGNFVVEYNEGRRDLKFLIGCGIGLALFIALETLHYSLARKYQAFAFTFA